MQRMIRMSWVVFFFIATAFGTPKLSWNEWVQQLRQEAISEGINPNLFDQVFRDIPQPSRRVLHFDKTQPERRITFNKYRATRIDPFRIKLGVKEFKKHRALLEDVSKNIGVDPCFIVAIWGIESSYGRYLGEFPVVKSLATLAYDDRRSAFFRKELLIALHILNEGHVSNENFKGEWAGASGHPQFLPSSWKRYAIDYNRDGHKDIWRDYPDVFASIANYLKQNGWVTGEPWSIQVILPANFPKDLTGYQVKKSLSVWKQLGVKPAYGFAFPQKDLMASIIQPYGGPTFMAFQNFRTLLRYNSSTFYAGSVGYLADQICAGANRKSSVFANKIN